MRMRLGSGRFWLLHGVSIVSALAMLLIPVRCDASPMPHSIFFDPVHAGEDREQRPAATIEVIYTLPGSDRSHRPHSHSFHSPSPTLGHVASTTSKSADVSSLETSMGTLDAPFSILLPGSALVQPADVIKRNPQNTVPNVLNGIAIDPQSPPPRPSL